jgi:hypothetical protein
MLFNRTESLTFSQIEHKLALSNNKSVLDAIKKLCNPAIGVLTKEVKKPVFNPDDKISINRRY